MKKGLKLAQQLIKVLQQMCATMEGFDLLLMVHAKKKIIARSPLELLTADCILVWNIRKKNNHYVAFRDNHPI